MLSAAEPLSTLSVALFDAYLTVDWSGAASPRTGKDSIWLHLVVRRGAALESRHLSNPPTRVAATGLLRSLLQGLVTEGKRVLVGFDFPFGYPAGTAQRLGLSGPAWRAMWDLLRQEIRDEEDNTNNRFRVAAMLNQRLSGGAGPFWGCPTQEAGPWLSETKPRDSAIPERRAADRIIPSAQPVWKLYTTGSVGSQALLGIPCIAALRTDPGLSLVTAIWPFETGLTVPAPEQRVVLAEVYPSLVTPVRLPGFPKDAGQVVAIARHFANRDIAGLLGRDLSGPDHLTTEERRAIETEEAWILGAGTQPFTSVPRDADGIYAESWRQVRAATDLSDLAPDLHEIAIRLVHTGADPSLAQELRASPLGVPQALKSLQDGRPILVDAAMVAAGITRKFLIRNNPVICTLDQIAKAPEGTTRSAAAVDLWEDADLEGAIVAIGNAPTALERLLDRLALRHAPKPAAILGFCVGFIGAAEAKARLMGQRKIPWIALEGRRGGSALAAAAINALALDAAA